MRLPDIRYDREVRPLAKEDPGIAARKAQVEIDLSRVQLGADLDKASKIGQANIRLAREMLAADQRKIETQAKTNIEAFNIKSRMAVESRAAKMQLGVSLLQTAVQVGTKWYEANEDAKAAKAITAYNSGVTNLSAELSRSPVINLDEHPDVDFSQIPEHMIYEGVDELTGKKIRSAPNHVAAPAVWAKREAELRMAVSKGIDSQYTLAKFENGVASQAQAAQLQMVKAKFDHETKFLSGQYASALDDAIKQTDLPTAVAIIDSAEARGVWTAEEAGKRRSTISGDIKFAGTLNLIDAANSLDDVKALRSAITDGGFDKSTMVTLRSQLAQKENTIEQEVERNRQKAERALVNIRQEQAVNVGIGAGGLKDYESGRQAVVDWAMKTDPENARTYSQAWSTHWSQVKTAEAHQRQMAVDQAYEAIYRDPTAPIPATVTGADVYKLEEFREKQLTGVSVHTDMTRWNELHDMMTKNPQKFAQHPIGREGAYLSEGDMKFFKQKQAEIVAGKFNPTEVAAAGAQFEDYAKQVFGPRYQQDKKTIAQANALRQAYQTRVWQLESEQRAAASGVQRTDILNDLFKNRAPVLRQTILGSGFRQDDEVEITDKKVAEYVPAITTILRVNNIPVTADNIMREYNARLRAGQLEELDL